MFSSTSTPHGRGAGGQNQVLLTVLGLRALGHRVDARRARGRRAAAARAGRARAHSADADDRDGSQRGLAAVAADQAAPPRRRPRARSARRRDGGAGALDEHAARQAAAGRGPPRRLPHQEQRAVAVEAYRQVDCFICASEAIRKMLVADGVPAVARGHRSTKGSTSGTSRRRRPRTSTRSCGCPTTRRSSATSPRWCRTRGSGT